MRRSLLYGLELALQFGQHWMVATGLVSRVTDWICFWCKVHFWNLHLDTVALSRLTQRGRSQPHKFQKYPKVTCTLLRSEFHIVSCRFWVIRDLLDRCPALPSACHVMYPHVIVSRMRSEGFLLLGCVESVTLVTLCRWDLQRACLTERGWEFAFQ